VHFLSSLFYWFFFISKVGSKNTSKIVIFRSFSMKFFFNSESQCMLNTIQSVFLRISHVFVSIYRLFQKFGVFQCCILKLQCWYLAIEVAIFDEIFDPTRVFLVGKSIARIFEAWKNFSNSDLGNANFWAILGIYTS
jgi:hypothetical protein